MRLRRTLALAAPIAALAVVAGAGAASAQDCFIANRSDQGSTSAGTHSKVWVAIPVSDVLAGSGLCDAQVTAAVDAVKAAGLPTVLATRIDKTIGEGTGADANGNLGDGKGLEHFEDSPLAEQILGTAFDAAGGVSC